MNKAETHEEVAAFKDEMSKAANCGSGLLNHFFNGLFYGLAALLFKLGNAILTVRPHIMNEVPKKPEEKDVHRIEVQQLEPAS